jgi:GAF domain-containing protein
MADPNEALTESLRALSQFLLGDQTPREGLLRVAQLGESALAGAKATGVTLLDDDGRPKTFAYTAEEAPEVDHLQYAEGDGPCLDAYKQKKVIRVDSNRAEERWPKFTSRAVDKGVLSSLSVPLVVDDRGIGALNFYAHTEHAFSAKDEAVGLAFAEQAAVIMANAQAYWGARDHIKNLDEAMRSRAVIEQAKGILMARSSLDPEEAFDVLRRASQRENRKLRDVAADLVEHTQKGRPAPGS